MALLSHQRFIDVPRTKALLHRPIFGTRPVSFRLHDIGADDELSAARGHILQTVTLTVSHKDPAGNGGQVANLARWKREHVTSV